MGKMFNFVCLVPAAFLVSAKQYWKMMKTEIAITVVSRLLALLEIFIDFSAHTHTHNIVWGSSA